MKLSFLACPEELKNVLSESRAILGDAVSDDGTPVSFSKSTKAGYSVTDSGDHIELSYHDIPSCCRGLLYLESVEKASTVSAERAFPAFGIMLDASRNAVPRVDTVKQVIRNAAFMGYSFVGLYMEDTMETEGEPYIGYMRGAYTRDELKELDSYAKLFGMELRPYIQTLAHMNQIVRYQEYEEITDTDDILLVGEERTKTLIEHLIAAIAGSFSTKTINIGMDEAHMAGLGKYLDKHGFRDRTAIIREHLDMVLSICEKYGLHAQMWSDMFFRLAYQGEYYVKDDAVAEKIQVPENLSLGYWDYYSTEESHYDDMLQKHLAISKDVIFAGCAWKWTGFLPHNRYSIKAGKAALSACKKNGVQDVVITCWGDDGAEASVFSVLPALFADANEAYGNCLPEAAFERLTGISFETFLAIDDGNPYIESGETHNNSSKYLLYNDPLLGIFDSLLRKDAGKKYEEAAERAKKAQSGPYAYIFESAADLAEILVMKADFGVRLKKAYKAGDRGALSNLKTEAGEILKRLETFYQAFRRQWYRENKPFGFEVQTIRLGGLMQRFRDLTEILEDYLSERTEEIPELEIEHRPFHYTDETDMATVNYNLWINTVSAGKI